MFISNKTLVIRFSSIGDIVLASPLIRVLRTHNPSSQIDFVVRKEYAELVRYNPNLNIIYEYDAQTGLRGLRQLKERIRSEKYDLVVDIHDSLRSRYLRSFLGAQNVAVVDKRIFARTMLVKYKKNIYKDIIHVADRYIEPVKPYGIENDAQGLDIFIPDETMFKVTGKMSSLKLHTYKKVIGFCPSAKHMTKRWPEERFIETGIRLVHELKAKILIFGGHDDASLCTAIVNAINKGTHGENAVEFSRQFSLLETSAAMQFCDVVLSNDSGLMHIAAAMKKKIIALFGSTVEEFGFFPAGSESIVLERRDISCRPCSHIGRDSCPEGHFNCMKEIQVEEVIASIQAVASRT